MLDAPSKRSNTVRYAKFCVKMFEQGAAETISQLNPTRFLQKMYDHLAKTLAFSCL